MCLIGTFHSVYAIYLFYCSLLDFKQHLRNYLLVHDSHGSAASAHFELQLGGLDLTGTMKLYVRDKEAS